jgi:sortase A
MPSLGAIGRALLVLAGLIVAFVAYQLWGTGIIQSQQQSALRAQFDRSLAAQRRDAARSGTGHGAAVRAAPATTAPAQGRPVATLTIPKIGLDQVVVEGVGTAQLAVGPGHYPGTALPGQSGNAAVAGHRTTHGRPFYDLNELVAGDQMTAVTVQGTFRYRVARSEVVAPNDVSVLAPSPVAELTLTTCTPRYTAARRLVVVAVLESAAAGAPSPSGVSPSVTDGPDPVGQAGNWIRLVAWAVACGAVVLVAWRVGRRHRRRGARRWTTALVAVPVATVVLFFFFGAVNALLPASF